MINEKDLNKLSEQIKKADNVLVAVNSNPTIDELTSALALTLMLNKNDRRAVTIFSGEVPDVLQFLKIDETFDKTVDGLRDFIVTLDSKKADRVVVKAEDNMVKVFITPSGQTISSDDLGFEQGDYNIDLIIGVGVSHKDDLDKALSAHGRILHNASVTSLSIGGGTSELGGLNIKAPQASSYAEIIYRLPELLDKNLAEDEDPAMDEAVATALLTSLVAATNRFSNSRTTAEIMSLASDLMRAGANQQLIAKELAKGGVVEAEVPSAEEGSTRDQSQKAVSVRPEDGSGEMGSINLKSQSDKSKTKAHKEMPTPDVAVPKKKDVPSVDGVEIGPNFANLEEYNKQQMMAERQSTADEVLSRLPTTEVPVPVEPPLAPAPGLVTSTAPASEDDRLAEQLQRVGQIPDLLAVETAATVTEPVAEPDPTIVFGKETPERPYLQDPSTAWGQPISNVPVASTPNTEPPEPLRDRSSQVVVPIPEPVASEVIIETPTPVEAPVPTTSTPEPVVPVLEPATPIVQPPELPAMPQFTAPPVPDFGAMNVTPPIPPTPPDFNMPMPPLPPNPADFAQPAAVAQQQFESSAAQAVESPVVETTPPPIIPTGRYQPAATITTPSASPVMTDQIYPQSVDNAQFVIPE